MSIYQRAETILQNNSYKICPQQYYSQGSFGFIVFIEDKNKQQLAAKVSQILVSESQSVQGNKDQLVKKEDAIKEANLLNAARHENIVRFEKYFIEGDLSFLIMERAQENLSTYLKNKSQNSQLDEKQFLKIMIQLVDGLEFLHEQKFVIRDIKLDNILVFEEEKLKYCDFGLSQRYFTDEDFEMEMQSSLKGNTLGWPPEIYQIWQILENDKDYLKNNQICQTQKGDVWALGVVLLLILGTGFYKIWSLKSLTSQLDEFNILGKDVNQLLQSIFTSQHQRPTIKEVQKKLKKIVANRKSEKYRVKAMKKYLKVLEFSQAEQLFFKAIQKDQENSNAYSSYALFLNRIFGKKKQLEIDQNIQIALALNKNNQEAQLLQLLKSEDIKQRIKQLEKFNLQDPFILVSLALDHLDEKNYNLAEKYFLESINNFPNYGRAYLNYGNLLYENLNNLEKAIDILLQGLNRDISDSVFLSQIGYIHEQKGEKDLAEKYYKIAINSNPKCENSFYKLGQFLFYANQDYNQALEIFKQITIINPQNEDSYFEIGKLFSRLKNYAEAQKYFEKSLEINPKLQLAHLNLMVNISESPNYKDRKEEITYHFEQAKQIDPNYTPTYYVYGEILESKYNDIKNALKSLKEGFNIDQNKDANKLILSLSQKLKA